ncbi:DUF397 domain-containing protein [Streptomyces sp. NBC_01314]|uniref:DUF397 domain-containing protein n=1 Tax=Streptomyces sp. NBC_01314 TaxID=2903821 RepID=UPI003086D2F9|nr:DUF397 domain-containing protein [Streptomyces sp. NBC_01314]
MSSHPQALELAGEEAWFKSSYSSDQGASCIEIADLIPTRNLVAVRDSKAPGGPALLFPPDAFTAFVGHVRTARTDPAVRTGG